MTLESFAFCAACALGRVYLHHDWFDLAPCARRKESSRPKINLKNRILLSIGH